MTVSTGMLLLEVGRTGAHNTAALDAIASTFRLVARWLGGGRGHSWEMMGALLLDIQGRGQGATCFLRSNRMV